MVGEGKLKKGSHHTPEAILKNRLAHLGKHHTSATRIRMSESRRGLNNPFYGKQHSIGTLRKMSEIKRGKKLSKATRLKMSISHKGKPPAWMLDDPTKRQTIRQKITQAQKGKKPWNKGLTKDNCEILKEMGKKLSRRFKGRRLNTGRTHFQKGHIPWHKGKHKVFSRDVIEEIRTRRLKQIFPKKDTSIELKLQNALKTAGITFLTHYTVWHTQVDIAIPKGKIAVFCEGCYWHCCPNCYGEPTTEAQKRNVKWDAVKRKKLEEMGWVVLRIWEHEINNKKELEETIKRFNKYGSN